MVWTQDEAGPYQTIPYPGVSWQPRGQPERQPHEYIRNGTAKLLTLFHPASGRVRVKGVTSSANVILHPWLKAWLFAHGIMPLYTPLGGSWLNMAESMQRILSRRGLAGQHPKTPAQIIALLEGVAKGWNLDPTPFEWGGKRFARRQRSRQRRHILGGSGACSRRPVRRSRNIVQKWQLSCQTTH